MIAQPCFSVKSATLFVCLSGRTEYHPGMSGTRHSRATGNREGTGKGRPPVSGQWKPGQSGNPSGRPKGISAAVREKLDARGGPDALADALLDALEDPRLKPLERLQITRELWDRGYGKAPAFAAMEGGDPLELTETQEFMGRILDELSERRQSREGAPADSGASAADG